MRRPDAVGWPGRLRLVALGALTAATAGVRVRGAQGADARPPPALTLDPGERSRTCPAGRMTTRARALAAFQRSLRALGQAGGRQERRRRAQARRHGRRLAARLRRGSSGRRPRQLPPAASSRPRSARSRSPTGLSRTACSPATTSRCCKGSRVRTAAIATRSTGARPIWSASTWASSIPSCRGGASPAGCEQGKLVPYADRAAIDRGALAGRELELLWVDDPVDRFFLEIQGSGQVKLPDGGDHPGRLRGPERAAPTARSART